jgi:nucleotide-binding universal stress UspA family protein
MLITSTDPRPGFRRPLGASRSAAGTCRPMKTEPEAAPIVVAVDNSRAAATAAQAAVRLARGLTAPLVFVYVRRGPSSALGEPYYQRRLDAEMTAGRRALNDVLEVAARAGVPATGEELAGNAARRVVEFASSAGRGWVVLGSRRRRLGRSVSRDVIRRADRPVLVAGRTAPVAA